MKANLTSFKLAACETAGCQDACGALQLEDALIAVIADGVGRAEHATEAAHRTVQSFLSNFRSRPRTWSIPRALEEFARLINRALHQESLARLERPEWLSTVGVAALEGETLYGINAGDSRVYLFQRGTLTQLSTDHVENGHELRHVLSRAVGLGSDLTPQHFQSRVESGDLLLLCTDGVSTHLDEPKLKQLLKGRASARTIVMAARERATEETLDDMAAIVVEVVETDRHKAACEQLHISMELKAGQTIEGVCLERSFDQSNRIWLGTRAGRPVVIKFAPVEARENEAIFNQFVKELWTLTRLQADYFLPAEVPEHARELCYCMEYLEAPTLREFLRSRALRIDESIALARFLLEAGQYLVGLDLLHGDIKPDNILVLKVEDGLRFKLIDFGSVTEPFSITSRAGTPSYLAPERFGGAAISERTELFSIGATLYQALTGSLPYGEIEPFQTPVFRHAKGPARFNPHVSSWLEAVVLRAIAPDPADRYQNYSEMKFELEKPDQVRPFVRADAPLLERNPLLFYKTGFFVLLGILLVVLLLGK